MSDTSPAKSPRLGGLLGTIEWLGNKLPDPIFLFIGATLLVFVLSAVGDALDWSVQPVRPQVAMETIPGPDGAPVAQPRLNSAGRPVIELIDAGSPVRPRSLLSSEGIYWLAANAVRNFINFAPLGVVLVSMLGIGVAEKVGFFSAAMRYLALLVPGSALTPMIMFLGIVSNVASDAGYIVLPPLAAALYAALGRPPLAGIAAAFAGVAGGFSANLLVGSTDALIAPLTERGARVLDPSYTVLATCNWFFLAGSTFLLVFVGWFVTARIVEPRLAARPHADSPPEPAQRLTSAEVRGLRLAAISVLLSLAAVAAMLFVPGAPLAGSMPAPAPIYGTIPTVPTPPEGAFSRTGDPPPGQRATPGTLQIAPGTTLDAADDSGARGSFRLTSPATATGALDPAPAPQPRWSQAVVPIILVVFLIPGLVFGFATGALRTQKDVSKAFVHCMATMAPIIAMAFFAAQFIEVFKFSRLDAMLANAGGKALVSADLPRPLMLVGVIALVMVVNLLMSSMSAKWTAMSLILVPMLMMSGVSPELTQAAYRVGDSVTNIVTPLNSYIIVILAAVHRYQKDAGIGNLIAMMMPYSIFFFISWTIFLLAWVELGIPLGPNAPLTYTPGAR
ncbi:MAG: AbgT family transporter [Planctomycetota bacterium]|nr:AbgT family transporter [Planctomycetota bacterium]